MAKRIRLGFCAGLFVLFQFAFDITLSVSQSLPPICTLNGRWLTGPEFLENTSMTAQDIRDFLQARKSWLVGEPPGGKNPGKVMDIDGTYFDFPQAVIDAAAYPNAGDPGPIAPKPINPQLLLAMVEKESSMITAKSRPTAINDPNLTGLTGCGTPDNMRGQIKCAARTLRNRFDQLAKCESVSNPSWNLNSQTPTRDGQIVQPANASIGANYVYNPVAGVLLGGQTKKGGVARFCALWNHPTNQGGFGFASPPTQLELGPINPVLTCIDPLTPINRRDVTLSVAGGTPPYKWAASKGTIQACGPNQEDAVVKPPPNSNPSVLGDAYVQYGGSAVYQNSPTCTEGTCQFGGYISYGCNDQRRLWGDPLCTRGYQCAVPPYPLVCNARNNFKACYNAGNLPVCDTGMGTGTSPLDYLWNHPRSGAFCDARSEAMKAAGCKPCTPEMIGTVITVTGVNGASVTAPLVVK